MEHLGNVSKFFRTFGIFIENFINFMEIFSKLLNIFKILPHDSPVTHNNETITVETTVFA
jgi:hypothetical protein